MREKLRSLLWGMISCLIWILLGLALCIVSFVLEPIRVEPYLKWVVLAVGVVVLIVAAICLAVFSSRRKKIKDSKCDEESEQPGKVVKPSQTSEDKLAQIDFMDETQFLMCAYGLYQKMGHSVRFAPVVSDSGFWFIADKLGSEQMVVCVHGSNIITKEGLEECMANLGPDASKPKTLFTNAKLDKSAKRFARKKDIEVIDRNQLLDDWL